MRRRDFLATSAAAALPLAAGLSSPVAAASPATAPNDAADGFKPGLIEWRDYRLHQGSQGGRLDDWMRQQALPLFSRHGFAPMGFFHVSLGVHTPRLVQIIVYRSLGERETQWNALNADPQWRAARETLETGPEFPYDDLEVRFFTALPFTPQWPPAPGEKRHAVYEVRTYQSPTERQSQFVVDRFASGEKEVFHRSGFFPVFYSQGLAGPMLPNLTYLIPFESMGQRDECWSRFGKDPAWPPLLKESQRRGGDVIRQITNEILSPTDYSALR